jgi:putative ABC transport system substrate-binding protein
LLLQRQKRRLLLPTIGFLGATTPSAMGQWAAAFVQRLHELGWIEDRTITIEYRWSEGRTERYAEAEFVRLNVNVIVTVGCRVVRRTSRTWALGPTS